MQNGLKAKLEERKKKKKKALVAMGVNHKTTFEKVTRHGN